MRTPCRRRCSAPVTRNAGVLVTLGHVVALLTQAAAVSRWSGLRLILPCSRRRSSPAGFFFSVIGADPARPNALMRSVRIGFGVLISGLIVS